MSWFLLIVMITTTTDNDVKSPESTTSQHQTNQDLDYDQDHQPQPSLEVLLFLAEWQDNDNNQWLDPEAFAAESTMNKQLDTQKENQDEKDPDNN